MEMLQKNDFFKPLAVHNKVFQVMGLAFFSLDDFQSESFFKKHKYNFGSIVILSCVATYCFFYISLVTQAGIGKSANVEVSEILEGMTVSTAVLSMLVVILTAMITTKSEKKIFINLQRVALIFKYNLQQDLDYSRISSDFKRIFIGNMLWLFGLTAALWLWTYNNMSLHYTLTIAFSFSVILFIEICFMRFIFYVTLIRFHIEAIEKAFKCFKRSNDTIQIIRGITVHAGSQPIDFVQQNEINLEAFSGLKKVYGIIYTTTDLINHVCGCANLIEFGSVISYNIIGGYSFFLAIKRDIHVGEIACN